MNKKAELSNLDLDNVRGGQGLGAAAASAASRLAQPLGIVLPQYDAYLNRWRSNPSK